MRATQCTSATRNVSTLDSMNCQNEVHVDMYKHRQTEIITSTCLFLNKASLFSVYDQWINKGVLTYEMYNHVTLKMTAIIAAHVQYTPLHANQSKLNIPHQPLKTV